MEDKMVTKEASDSEWWQRRRERMTELMTELMAEENYGIQDY